MGQTSIEWTDVTWNPARGCSRVSEGCRNCYAERIAARFSGSGIGPAEFTARSEAVDLPPFFGFASQTDAGPRWTGKVDLVESALMDPLHWRKPRRVFVNSMSDLFHEGLRDDQIDRVFAVMALCPRHTFQVLTKRPERMWKWATREKSAIVTGAFISGWARIQLTREGFVGADEWEENEWTEKFPWLHPSGPCMAFPLHNVWLGVSVENQETADTRIPFLLRTPCRTRFISYEPALGPVDFSRYFATLGIDWVIVGGESGPGSRPFNVQWAREVLQQCKAAGVACFVKQLGSKPHSKADKIAHRGASFTELALGDGFYRFLNDGKGGDIEEFPPDLRVREFPVARANRTTPAAALGPAATKPTAGSETQKNR